MWEPVEAGPMVAELIRLETGEGRGDLNAREREQIARLRRLLLLTIPARRAAGVAIATDPHADSGRALPSRGAEMDTAAPDAGTDRLVATPYPATTMAELDDVELHRLARRAHVDGGISASAVHLAAAAEHARRLGDDHTANELRRRADALESAARDLERSALAELDRAAHKTDRSPTALAGRPRSQRKETHTP
jgi:hypothetical protein